MPRLIIRPRTAFAAAASDAGETVQSLVSARAEVGAKVVKSRRSGLQVVHLSSEDAQELAATRPDLIVEEDQALELYAMPGLPAFVPEKVKDSIRLRVRDSGGNPIPDCTVFAVGPAMGFRGVTDAKGSVTLEIDAALIDRVIVSPRAGFWSMVLDPKDAIGQVKEVVLSAIDPVAASAWIHALLGTSAPPSGATGHGVGVAVVDSGIAPVAGLSVADGLNTLDEADPSDWATDEHGHGTHCAGIVGARPSEERGFRGIAPGATLYSLKVFPGGFVSDLIESLEWCRERKIDLVNMSLGSPLRSEALARAIDETVQDGIVIVAASGNDASTVSYPAALPNVIAVSAIGRFGTFPAESGHSLKVGVHRDWWGGLFDANFNNTGPEINVCAPGVAIPSTVPQGYAAWDGTSMACPAVTGLLALVLEAFPMLRTSGLDQFEALRWILAAGAVDTGMPPAIQGAGLPTAARMLAAAATLQPG